MKVFHLAFRRRNNSVVIFLPTGHVVASCMFSMQWWFISRHLTYPAPNIIVVQVHQSSCIALDFPCIHKRFSKVQSVDDIITASSPFKALSTPSRSAVITWAFFQFAMSTGTSYLVDHTSGWDSIHKSCLFARYGMKMNNKSLLMI